MSIAHHRSVRKIAAFRGRYLVEHTDATWFDAGLAYVMQAGPQQVGHAPKRAGREPADYAAFVKTARAFAQASVEPPKPTGERVVTKIRLGLANAVTSLLNAN